MKPQLMTPETGKLLEEIFDILTKNEGAAGQREFLNFLEHRLLQNIEIKLKDQHEKLEECRMELDVFNKREHEQEELCLSSPNMHIKELNND